jgi:hypothetical protein
VSWASEAHLSRACGYDHAAPLVLTQSEVIEGDEIAAFPAVLSTLPNLAGVHCQRGLGGGSSGATRSHSPSGTSLSITQASLLRTNRSYGSHAEVIVKRSLRTPSADG